MTDGRWRPGAPATVATLLILFSLAVGVAAAGPVVGPGTTFEASDSGPTITITEQLELADSDRFPDGNTVDLSPNATFSSSGDTTATVDQIDGPWTNVSTTDVSNGLTINASDKQSITVEGSSVSAINISSVDPTTDDAALSYDAGSSVNVTVTGLRADRDYAAFDIDNQNELAQVTTDGSGTATFTLESGTNDVTIQRVIDIDTGGGGGGGDGDGDPTSVPDSISDGSEDDDSEDNTNEDGSEEMDSGEGTTEQSRTVETRIGDTVSRVTFENPAEGGVDIEEVPPDSVADEVREAVSDGSGTESGGGETVEPDVVTVLDITPTSDQAEEMGATVELTVDSENLTDPERAVILHETETGWKRLDTSATVTGNGTTTLTADVESFSLFAVAQLEDGGETQQTDDTSDDETTDSTAGDETTDSTAGDDGNSASDDGTTAQSDTDDGTADSQTQEQVDGMDDQSGTDDSDTGLPLVPLVLLLVALAVVAIAVVGYQRQSGTEAKLR